MKSFSCYGSCAVLFFSLAFEVAAISLRNGRQGTTVMPVASQPAKLPQPAQSLAIASTNQTRKQPLLIFLFLVYDKINNEAIWDRFFASAAYGSDYRVFVHCKYPHLCRENIKSQHRYVIIPSVQTKYCTDLVSGMNALLKSAVTYTLRQAMQSDKFIFLSDSTIPVKPFSTVRARLLPTGTNSNFCIFPRNEWAEIHENQPGFSPSVRAAVKAHQWIILSRTHVETILRRSQEHLDLMSQFRINTWPMKNTGCLDEYSYFAILFGTISHATNPQSLSLNGLGGLPISTTNYEIQGQCDTFVQWVPRATGTVNNMTGLIQKLSTDPGVDMTAASDKRPAAFHRFSLNAVINLRQSWFLFARKVDDAATFSGCDQLVDVFDKVIFSVPPQQMIPAPPFQGAGAWRDTRNAAVTIAGTDGAIQLQGQGNGMDGKGRYCGSRMEVVFANGYKAAATLTPDATALTWDTGVSWHRA